jgi:hypothetical protein
LFVLVVLRSLRLLKARARHCEALDIQNIFPKRERQYTMSGRPRKQMLKTVLGPLMSELLTTSRLPLLPLQQLFLVVWRARRTPVTVTAGMLNKKSLCLNLEEGGAGGLGKLLTRDSMSVWDSSAGERRRARSMLIVCNARAKRIKSIPLGKGGLPKAGL